MSTIVLSTSVSSPTMVRRTSFPRLCFISRTIRFIFWNTPEIGTMRKDMAISCRSLVSLRSWRADFIKLSLLSLGSRFNSGEDVTMDSVITISPTISIRLSSFIRLTLIRFCLTGAWESIGAAFPAAVSVDAGAGAVGLETDAFFSSAFAGGAAFGTFTSS